MTRLIPLTGILALAICAGAGIHAQPSDNHNYSKSQIKQMIRDAHTAQQYRDLSAYSDGRGAPRM